jgi:HSP20 family protein
MASRWYEIDSMRDVTSLRSAMDRLMEQAIVRRGTFVAAGQHALAPAMNVSEHGNQYLVQVMLPGVHSDDVELTVRQNTLSVKGHWADPLSSEQGKQVTYLLQEFGGGEFSRTITLPKSIASERVEAQFEDGILSILLPLAAQEQSRQISIKSSRGGKSTISRGDKKEPKLVEPNSH